MRIEFTLTINKPAEEIWRFMFDLKNVPKWDPGVVEARQTNEPPLERVGATIQTLGQGGSDRGLVRVAEFEMYRRVVFEFVPSPGVRERIKDAKLTYTFEPVGDKTLLTRVVEARLVGFWKLFQPLVSRKVDKDSKEEAANIMALFQPVRP